MKKLLCILLCLCTLTACGGSRTPSGDADKPRIVVTIFPLYDWTRQILGKQAANVDLTLLLRNGTDMHSYQPTVDDMILISDADLFIYVGGESDAWVKDALKGASGLALNLMDTLGGALQEEEALPGMETEPEAGTTYDEHIWLSLKNAQRCCVAIADMLDAMDIVSTEDAKAEGYASPFFVFSHHADEYTVKMMELDARYRDTVQAAPLKSVLFADRFPFRYLAADYGLDVYAAFQGCSAETEASFETIAFLSGKLDELSLPAVLTTESADGRLAETIIRTSGRPETEILSMNSMQSVTEAEIASGTDYLSVMEANLGVLSRALGVA